MRIEQLEYLIDIAKTGSINISADRLYVTQPTISEAINKLEKELGASLLIRHTKGVTLTLSGQAVLQEAEAILGHIAQIKLTLSEISNQYDHRLTGEIKLGSTQICNSNFLSKLLLAFSNIYPHIKIRNHEVYQYDSEAIFKQLDVDFGFTHCIANTEYDSFDFENLRRCGYEVKALLADEMYIAAHKSMDIAKTKLITLGELVKHPVIYLDNNIYGTSSIKRIMSHLGKFDNIFSTGSRVIFNQYIIEGMRAGLVTKKSHQIMVEGSLDATKNIKLIPLKEKIVLEYFQAKALNHERTPALVAFENFLYEQVGK